MAEATADTTVLGRASHKSADRAHKATPNKVMFDFFLSTLDVRIKLIDHNSALIHHDVVQKDILSEIHNKRAELANEIRRRCDKINSCAGVLRSLLSANADNIWDELWNDAYRLQRLVALIEPKETLFVELTRVINHSVAERIPSSDRLKKSLDKAVNELLESTSPPIIKEKAENTIRMLLLDALEQLQWFRQRKFLMRLFQKQATRRTVVVGFIAFVLFVLPYAYLYLDVLLTHEYAQHDWIWLPDYSALVSGLFGALFSRLIFLQRNARSMTLGAIADAGHWLTILLRGIVGMCGALIVYFFLQSGLVTGSIFPEFRDLGIEIFSWPNPPQGQGTDLRNGITTHILLADKALALLVIWSFLAGFSERLVPNILASTEKTFTEATRR